jgi:GxxExxY protein
MSDTQLVEEQLTHSVIGAFYDVYNALGYGFLEQVYTSALERELRSRGHVVGREVYVPVIYKGDEISRQRIDMIIDQRLVVEAKATQELHKSAKRQVYNYLRATRLQVGLLLHFGPEPCFYRLDSGRTGE